MPSCFVVKNKSLCSDQEKSSETSKQGVSVDQEKASEKSEQVLLEWGTKPGERVDQDEKVHIPDSFDESDADSETLSDKLRGIDAYADVAHENK